MLTFLFWNLKQPRADLLASLTKWHSVDVLMLAECSLNPGTVLLALNGERSDFFYVRTECPKVRIYTRFSDEYLIKHRDGGDYSIRKLRLIDRPEVLLCVVHFPSKLWQDRNDQSAYAMKFSEQLANAEEEANHTRTILVGDLNMNPFEDGMVTTTGLHAVPTRQIALREKRRVNFESNLYFYNPMWRHFGEQDQGHAGTYYYGSPKARADFWNIYDQVLLRPSLLAYFDPKDLLILHRDEGMNISFLTPHGVPDARAVSDHLPILFRLQI